MNCVKHDGHCDNMTDCEKFSEKSKDTSPNTNPMNEKEVMEACNFNSQLVKSESNEKESKIESRDQKNLNLKRKTNGNSRKTLDNSVPEDLIYRPKRIRDIPGADGHGGKLEMKYRQESKGQIKFEPHFCSPECLDGTPNEIERFKKENPLMIPMFCGWMRNVGKLYRQNKKLVSYDAPCGRRLRDVNEVHYYLLITESQLTVDLFTFDSDVCCFQEFVPKNVNITIPDLSYGIETKTLPCVNAINHEYPNQVTYTTKFLYSNDINITFDPKFLVGCSCDDDCANSDNCACQQLTVESFKSVYGELPEDFVPGYKGRRLLQQISSGVYECNSTCKCSARCVNRVVQNDVTLRFQVFKTKNCGWGARCLDDVPKGCFVCLFTGQILTDVKANKDGTQYGDEYLADLDYIEVCENIKKDYEAFAATEPDDEPGANSETTSGFDEETSSQSNGTSRKRTETHPTNDVIPIKSIKSENNVSVRTLFGDESCHIVDAKFIGNIGRYLNHACAPNVFVQSVFVDSHDLRFPWVAFFAKDYICAGTELTWDYNYKIGSVAEKEMYCYCGSSFCRGRLL